MASEATWNPALWEAAGGRVPDGWSLVPFGNLLRSPKAIAVGVMYPGDDVPSGVPLIRVGDVQNGGTVGEPQMRISGQVHEEYRQTELKGDELLITLVGKPGACVLARPSMKGWNVARALAVARLQDPSLRPFIKTVLEGPVMRSIISGMLNTTVQPTLNLKEIRSLPVPVPRDHREAHKLGEVAELFNARIDLLRQTNATLESIGQALFKSWFIDFDPVRAKAEGREPEGMDAATAALFPAEFEESALGLIPKGWRVGDVYEVAKVIYGAPFSSKHFNDAGDGQPLVRIRDLRDEAPEIWTLEVHPKGHLLRPGDIVVGMDGEFRAYLWGGLPAWMNQRICCFQPIMPHCAAFVRCAIAKPLAHIEATEIATTVIHLGKGDIDRFNIVVPPSNVASAFASVCDPLYASIVSNKARARHLSDIRDALLPRLISGKLRLNEAQKEIEGAIA